MNSEYVILVHMILCAYVVVVELTRKPELSISSWYQTRNMGSYSISNYMERPQIEQMRPQIKRILLGVS